MNQQTVRKDNKSLMIKYDILFILLILFMYILNIMNTKDVSNMYVMTFFIGMAIIIYLIFYSIKIRRSKEPLNLEDNYLAFYVSGNAHNKINKIIIAVLDLSSIIGTLLITYYFFYHMNFILIYQEYCILVLGGLVFLQFTIFFKDLNNINKIDRIDALTNAHTFSITNKKMAFFSQLILICILNIMMLSFKKVHFIVYYRDLVIFETIVLASLILSLSSLFFTKLYYYHFNLKQIEQKSFNTKLLEEIGKGTFASVYKAYLPSLDSIYAVKKLESIDARDIQRFESEFKMMKSLQHPNILSVYSYNEIKYEYIMDYIPYTLKDFIKNNELTEEIRVDLINQLLDAFEYLHNHSILHRDISLTNIMIKENPSYKGEYTLVVTDFGMSKNKEKRFSFTRTHTTLKGTLFDPTLDNFKDYNVQNDIYNLGLVINYIYNQTEAISNSNFNSFISKVVYKCMDINLENRYKNVSEIKKEILNVRRLNK